MSRDITPISFKTVPGRNKTQKWTKAPAVDYGGDEWGGYDDYGDYDDDNQPHPSSIPPSQAPRDPYASSELARKNSFDQGDEARAFSSGAHPASTTDAFTTHGQDSQQNTPGRTTARDFTNPEQVPAPLSMHNSPVPVQGERWPGRKESMSSKGTPPVPSASPEKPLPFIRPSDIYKRIPDEIRRQSEDGARPSMDSIGSGPRERPSLGLEPVVENRESRVFLEDADESSRTAKDTSPRLPDVTRFSGFGTEFLTGSAIGNDVSPASPHSPEAIIARVANAPVVNTAGGTATTPSSVQHTPTLTRAPASQDPAAEILAERQYDTAVESNARGQPAGLQHQPSAGFRSAVHTAFDRNDNSISRDNSQGSIDVHRSDTDSTADISPIISRGAQFPSIAEETSTASNVHGQASDSRTRKPSPSRADSADFEPGYRRSLDPPSTGTSPARTPCMERVATRRLSTPMSAVPMDAGSSDVIDQGAEMPTATLEPAKTPASEVGELHGSGSASFTTAPVPITGRGRSGTDYSMREADIAQTINCSSPEKDHEMSGLVDAQRDSQKLFLQTHAEKQPPSPISPGGGLREVVSGSRAGSPTKGRVREIADRYHGLDEAARRNSAVSLNSSSKALSAKSSWSNFDEGDKRTVRQAREQNESEMFPAYENAESSPVRPGMDREESFRPDLPGGWISSAPTPIPEDGPGVTRPSPLTPQQTKAAQADEEDLTPTTKKTRLQEALTNEPSARTITDSNPPTALEQAKNAGAELGAALMASVGASHQTRDFGSSEPAAPVDEREIERPVRGMQPPTLFRHETDSDAPPSVASTMPPSPPAKDTPKLGETLSEGYFNTVAPLRVRSREESPAAERSFAHERSAALPRPGVTTALSMEPGTEDQESDRLRKEIVRSLDPMPPIEDAQLLQDSIDAPDNQHLVTVGENARPPAERVQPAILQTRFSWEKPTPLSEEAAASPEIKPEMSYERPRSKALHVVNPNEVESPAVETPVAKGVSAEILKPTTFGTPVEEEQGQTWIPDTDVQPGSPSRSLKETAPSPVSQRESGKDIKGQSYYASDSSQTAATSGPTVVPGQGGLATSPVSSAKAPGAGKPIPPFRNILALKTGEERIKTYNETRTTFANMNTGLGDWVGGMLALHPELTSNATTSGGAWKAPPLQTAGTGFLKGHKASPSLAKFTNKFGPSESQNRSTSVGSVGDDSTPSSSAAGVNIIRPTTSNTTGPSSSTTGLPAFDTDKMQQKGKAFMAKTGVLGGKAQAGAKGLFAKGKSRFASGGSVRSPSGNEKVVSSTPTSHDLAIGTPGAVSSPVAAKLASGPTDNVSQSRSEGRQSPSVSAPQSENPSEMSAVWTIRPSKELIDAPREEAPGAGEHKDDAMQSSVLAAGTTSSGSRSGDTPDGALNMQDVSNRSLPATFVGGETSASTSSLEVVDKKAEAEEPEEQSAAQTPGGTGRGAVASVVVKPDAFLARISTSPELPPNHNMAATSSARPATAYATTDSTETPKASLPSTPIPAVRPGFSRHASSKSASPFRGNSPFRRDPSHTPGSESKSRPLSMVWSDWLRDKTQSVSRSGSRRGGSRPASLMLDKDDGAVSSSMASGSSELALGDLSDVAVFSSSTTAPIAIPARIETWNSPDAVIPPRTPETRELELERLGILPSPAPTAATFESLDSRHRRRSSAARLGSTGLDGLGLDLETVPSQDSGGSPVRSIITGLTGKGSPVRPAVLGLRRVSEAEEVVMRPRQQRRVSDLEMLPSEQKRLSLGQGMPRPDSMILLQSQVDLLAGVGQDVAHENDWDRSDAQGDNMDPTRERIINGDDVQGAAETDAPPPITPSSRPATDNSAVQVNSDAWDDARSEISAEDGAADERQRISTHAGTSRHSSVSSLGAPDTAVISAESTLSAQAVPAGPMPASSSADSHNVPPARQRPQRPRLEDRAMSYMPLPRDEAGLPISETITTGHVQQMDNTPSVRATEMTAPLQRTLTTASLQQANTLGSNQSPVAVDLSAMSGPPPGTAPFQQHPLFRKSVIEPEARSGMPIAETSLALDTQDSTTTTVGAATDRNGIADASKRGSKRHSGFFGTSQAGETANLSNAPPANRITDQHGLEDLGSSDDQAIPGIRPRPNDRQSVDKRRSGFWEVLTSKRASSGAMLDISEDYTASPPTTKSDGKGREENAKRKLHKPQRASSSAVDLEPKKKRFSALGSLFGRSGSTGHGSIKANKLTKMIPANSENIRRKGSSMEDHPANSSTVTGNVQGYDDFEARRRRDLPAYQQTMSNIPPAAPNAAQERPKRSTDTTSAQPPPEGWYGPSAREQSPQQSYASPADNMQPEYRRLHSQGRTSMRPNSQVPPAFRPVEASFNGPVMAVGPPPDFPSTQHLGTSPGRSPGHVRNPSFHRQNSYETSYGSEFSGFSGQQVAGRAQQYTPSQRSLGPDVSPVPSRAGPPPVRGQRVTSLGYETARSPAKDYSDQQTPWAVTIPPSQESTPTSRVSSWDMAADRTHYPGPPQGVPYYQQQQQDQYVAQQGAPAYRPVYHEQAQGHVPRSYLDNSGSYASPYSTETNQQYQQQYSQLPQMQLDHLYPQQQQQQQHQHHHHHQQHNHSQLPRQRDRYYAQQTPAQQQAYQARPPQQHDSRMYHRRRSSGYSGRRDDMTAGEEELMMRGASYPGQEWQPPGLGRSGWD